MNELDYFCKDLKKNFIPKIRDPKKPVNFWSEKEIFNDRIVNSFVIILRTKGCSWSAKSGCSMCGYFNDSYQKDVSSKDLLIQFEKAMEKYNGEEIVKIFNSGSFFDDNEIKAKARIKILDKLSKKTKKISVESRPEYINQLKLNEIGNILDKIEFEIGIGLETADDYIRKNSINKGFDLIDYQNATAIMKKNGIKTKTYLLLKPPFLTEKEAIDDTIKSIMKINKTTDLISINPTNIHKNTYVEYLWKRNLYSPIWLWSIIDVLIKSKKIIGEKRIKSDIVAGGSIRGPHNCGKCDKKIVDNISKFSLNQNIELLKESSCECYDKWLDQIEIEKYLFGVQINKNRKMI